HPAGKCGPVQRTGLEYDRTRHDDLGASASLVPPANRPRDHPRRRFGPRIPALFRPSPRRHATEIALHQRTETVHLEAADEIEGEGTRVAEPIPVDLEGALYGQALEVLDSERKSPGMRLRKERRQPVDEDLIGVARAQGNRGACLLPVRLDGEAVEARGDELQVHELEKRLQVLERSRPGYPLVLLGKVHADAGYLAGEQLA